jgi:putative transposase
VRTWEGWLYLAVVMDLYSRRIVGWSTKPTMTQELVLNALLMAVRRRKPKHALIHSDQGSQFGSDAWRRFCHAHHLEPSMSRRGNCWDNAVAESFFSSLKKEWIKKRIYKTREMATAEIDEYIEMFYNRTRRHSHLSGVSPEAFEYGIKPGLTVCPQKPGKPRATPCYIWDTTLCSRVTSRTVTSWLSIKCGNSLDDLGLLGQRQLWIDRNRDGLIGCPLGFGKVALLVA